MEKSEHKVAGNTSPPQEKKEGRSRDWCFTVFNNPDWTLERIKKDKIRYLIAQKEIAPETKKEHWQGYVELFNPIKFNNLHEYIGTSKSTHVEPRRGTRDQAREYCRKDESAIKESRIEYGTWRETAQGHRSDLDEIGLAVREGDGIRDIAKRYPGGFIRYGRGIERILSLFEGERKWKTETVVIWGKTGVGKSKKAFEEYYKEDDTYVHSNTKWWNGYTGQSVVIWDEFELSQISRADILRLTDRYPLRLETKGSMVSFLAKQLILTTNEDPGEWIKEIPELKRRIDKIIGM